MKSYSTYMDEISDEELYKGLLAYGMFPEKLPPIFTAENFYNHSLTMDSSFQKGDHDYMSFDSVRNINIPRQLGIPNPMAYQRLCEGLKKNWNDLKVHFHTYTDSQTLHKISRIHIRKMKNTEVLFEMNYKNILNDETPEDDLIIGKKYIVRADISTCFPSIYTHSICWALAGKSVAKSNRNSGWYNDIDKLCQNVKNGETHGLIIGPHASNLLSEIILTVVDKQLSDKNWMFTRNIDDYTCYVKSEEECHQFLIDLNEALKQFDLPMNHKKTKIERLPIASSEYWIRELNAFCLVTSYGKVGYKEARAYFDLAVELMEVNGGNAATLNYAIKVLSKQKLTDNAKKFVVKETMHLSLIYPYLIPLMEEYVFKPYNVSKDMICHYSEYVYDAAWNERNYEGICYAIYYSLKYDFDLSRINVDKIIKTDSGILKLFGWLYFKKRNNGTILKLFRDEAKRLKTVEMDRNWLFIYETLTFGNLSGEWKGIKRAGISFLKSEYRY